MLQACQATPDYPNQPLAAGAGNRPPASVADADSSAPLVFIAFSGGGSRAAALGLGVLDELASATYPAGTSSVRLVDRVKVVSSVSGGSVVAAWFALVGPERMDELRSRFLAQNNMATLEGLAADPVTWGRLLFSSYTRIDALRDLLDRELFGGTTFADLRRAGAPFLILNATDMEAGEVFAFTPQRFDDICSDLDRLRISVGVAASAAYPVALSPMSLRNYSYEGCPARLARPQWIVSELNKPLPRYLDLGNYKQARYANALRDGPGRYRDEHYIHLLDGGLADNQGVHSLADALVSPHSQSGALDAINAGRAKRIVVIAVNARSDTDSGVGANKAVPDVFKVINTVIGTPIDSTTAYANASLQELLDTLKRLGPDAALAPGQPMFGGLRVYGVPIDFDQFRSDQSGMQTALKNIGTSWTLSPQELQTTLQAGRLLLRQHPCYQRLLLDLGSPALAVGPATAQHDCQFSGDAS